MKKTILLILLGVVCLAGYGQSTEDVARAKGNAVDATRAAATDSIKNTGNAKQNWHGLLAGFANLFGSAGNSFTLNPTLYALWHLDSLKDVNYEVYQRQWFLRNFQVNLGITPDNTNSFHLDSGSVGFKYAILNNLVATQRDYKWLLNRLTLVDSITDYLLRHVASTTTWTAFVGSGKYDETVLDPALVKQVKTLYHINDTVELKSLLSPEALQNALNYRLKIKPLWTFSVNDNYGFQSRQNNSTTFSSAFTYMMHFTREKRKDTLYVPIDFAVSYSLQMDTLEKSANTDRHVLGVALGKDFSILRWLELKPAVSYIHTAGPLYKKESEDAFNASLTPRIKINSNLWLPITVSYDPRNGQFLGWLSVQCSTK